MKRLSTSFLALALALTFAATVHAETRLNEETAVGFGYGLEAGPAVVVGEAGLLRALSSTITIPVQLNSFRLEPNIRFLRLSDESSSDDYDDMSELNLIEAGVGAFYTVAPEKKIALHFGARFGVVSTTESNEYSEPGGSGADEDTATDYFVRPALGAELFLIRWFSIGAEFGLNFRFIGERSSKSTFDGMTEDRDAEISGTLIYTQGGVFLRGYFR